MFVQGELGLPGDRGASGIKGMEGGTGDQGRKGEVGLKGQPVSISNHMWFKTKVSLKKKKGKKEEMFKYFISMPWNNYITITFAGLRGILYYVDTCLKFRSVSSIHIKISYYF